MGTEMSVEQVEKLLSVRKHPLAECESCPFVSRPVAKTTGPTASDVIFVSRSPGYHEAMAGRPFAGPSGKVLDYMLKEQGVTRDQIRLTNVVLCAPPSNKIPKEAIKACKPRLDAELSSAQLIIAGGSEAIASVFGKARSIQSVRGYRHELSSGQIVVATNNPAVVIRDDGVFPNLQSDFRRAFNPPPTPVLPKVKVIEDVDEAKAYITDITANHKGIIATDIETRGGLRKSATLISLQFATDGGRAVVLGERQGLWNDKNFIEGNLRPLFRSTDHQFLYHNGSFDTKVLRHSYNLDARIDHDSILLSYALDTRPGTHSLEYLLMNELDWPKYDDEEIKKIKKTGIVTDYNKFHMYAGLDVAGTYQLYHYLKIKAEKEGVF